MPPLLLSGRNGLSARSYAQMPPGGGGAGGGFPSFMMAQEKQKGEALKEYVRGIIIFITFKRLGARRHVESFDTVQLRPPRRTPQSFPTFPV